MARIYSRIDEEDFILGCNVLEEDSGCRLSRRATNDGRDQTLYYDSRSPKV
jgi:hypothetical protein